MNLKIDLSPLRDSAAYRNLYIAGGISAVGGRALYVATTYQLMQLTHSALVVGTLGLAEVVPLLAFGLYGGVIADRFSRKTVMLCTQVMLVIAAALLATNAAAHHPQAWAIFVLDALVLSAGSVQTPSVSALNQTLVSHENQKAASVLGSIRMTGAAIIGPSLGGFLAVNVGISSTYILSTCTAAASLYLLARLRGLPVQEKREATHSVMFSEGIQYARSRPDILGTYCVDLLAMAFAYPVTMLPFVAAQFHTSYALSLLYTALPLGALIATLTSAWIHRVHRYGRAIVFAACGWGLGIAVFGYFSNLWIVFVALVVAGGADELSAVFRQAFWNESIPPQVRGRMGGIEMISYALGPLAGQFRAGAMTTWISMRFSLTFGGLASTGSISTIAAALPALWKFDSQTDPYVNEVKALREAEQVEG